jgi:hypothetical protein
MKHIKISFEDEWTFDDKDSEEHMYKVLLEYLKDCVDYEDVTAFKFEEVKK